MQKDPIPGFRNRLLADELCSEDELAAIEATVKAEANAAFEEAVSTPVPDKVSILQGVYATPVPQA